MWRWPNGARLRRRHAFAYRDPEGFGELIEKLVEASATYLIGQLEAGADVVQIFDTWAGILPAEEFHRWCIEPVRRIVEKVRQRIAFSRKLCARHSWPSIDVITRRRAKLSAAL